MIITLSPAKVLDFKTAVSISKSTQPIFKSETNILSDELKNLSVEDIIKLMKVNPKQAIEVYQYFQSFNMDRTDKRQAMLTYNGMAFLGLDAKTLNEDDCQFAQKHLIIQSGLYGALRPLDMIKPYRLEQQIKLANSKGSDLYAYWGEIVTNYFSQRLQKDDKTWVNLSSNEYSKVINRKNLPKGTQIVTPIFKEYTHDGYKQVTVYAKKARGMMTRFAIQNRITKAENLKGFDTEGYYFAPELSKKEEWVFVR